MEATAGVVMRQLARWLGHAWLFRRDPGTQTAPQVVAWWELRRVPYNVIVGIVGVVAAVIMIITAVTCEQRGGDPIGLPDPPILAIFGVLVYGLMANICYTGGWVVELVVRKLRPTAHRSFGPLAFGAGLAFSVLITLLQAACTVSVAVATACRGYGSGDASVPGTAHVVSGHPPSNNPAGVDRRSKLGADKVLTE